MSGHCKKCFGVYGDHKADCALGAVGRRPPRCCVHGKCQPQAWVLLDDRTAPLQQVQPSKGET